MMIDALQAGDIIEMNWYAGSYRTIQMILINPVYSDIGTVNQKMKGWSGQTIYDSGSAQQNKVPYNATYEIRWLHMCERQGNLKVISPLSVKKQ